MWDGKKGKVETEVMMKLYDMILLKKKMVRKKGSDLKGLRGEAMPYIEIEEYDREHVEIGR